MAHHGFSKKKKKSAPTLPQFKSYLGVNSQMTYFGMWVTECISQQPEIKDLDVSIFHHLLY